jgi:hypothetical protein
MGGFRAVQVGRYGRHAARLGFREYAPKEYPGRIALFVNETAYRADKFRGWDGIPIDELIAKRISGDHITMFTEHGRELAQSLLESIDAATLREGCRTDGMGVSAS